MESLTATDLNLLVLRYLIESGFTDSAFKFGQEARAQNNNTDGNLVPYGALITLVQKGLQFLELGANLDVDVKILDQELISKSPAELRQIIKERRRKLQEDNDKEKREKGQEQDMQVNGKGFNLSAVTFGHEAQVHNNNTDGNLVTRVQKGLQYLELEANLDDEGFSFFKPLELISKSPNELRKIIKERRRKLQEDNDAKGKQEQDMQGDGKGPGETDAAASSSRAQKIASSDVVKLEGHTDEVFSCAWSPAGSALASGSGDATVRTCQGVAVNDESKKKKRDIVFAFSTEGVSLLKKAVAVMGHIGRGNAGVHADEDGIRIQMSNADTSCVVIEWEINSRALTSSNLSYKVEKWGFHLGTLRAMLENKKDIAENLHVTIDRNIKQNVFLFGDDKDETYLRQEVLMWYPVKKTRYRERDLLGCIEECYEIKSSSLCSILRELKAKDLSSVRLDVDKQKMSFSVSGTKVDIPLKEPPVLLASGVRLSYGEAIGAVIEAIEIAKAPYGEAYVMLAVGHGLVVMLKIPVQYGFCTFFFKNKVVDVIE